MLEKGIDFFEKNEFADAIELFAMALGHDQNNLIARKYLARCYFRLGRKKSYKKAKEHFEILSRCNDDEIKIYATSMLATVTSIMGDHSNAIKIMKKMPLTTNNLINMCIMYWQKFKAEGECWILEEPKNILLKIDIDNTPKKFHWRIHITLGQIYQGLEEYYLAEQHYKKAIISTNDKSTKAKILNELGNLFREKTDRNSATETLNIAFDYIDDKTSITAGYNFKYRGMLEKDKGMLTGNKQNIIKAKELLLLASNIFDENELLDELAEVNNALVEIENPDSKFYSLANLHTEATFTNEEGRR